MSSEPWHKRLMWLVISAVVVVIVTAIPTPIIDDIKSGVFHPSLSSTRATPTFSVGSIATNTATVDTANSYPSYLPGKGILVLSDPLHDNSKGYEWDEMPGQCFFKEGTYHVKAIMNDPCTPNATAVSNFTSFALEVSAKIISGGSCIIAWGFNKSKQPEYYFLMGHDGSYVLNSSGVATPTIDGNSTAIKQGLNQTNLIVILVKENNYSGSLNYTFEVYVNHQLVTSDQLAFFDNRNISGQVGFAVGFGEVIYSDAKVWRL